MKKVQQNPVVDLVSMHDNLRSAERKIREAKMDLARLKLQIAKDIIAMNPKLAVEFLSRKINSRDFSFFTQNL